MENNINGERVCNCVNVKVLCGMCMVRYFYKKDLNPTDRELRIATDTLTDCDGMTRGHSIRCLGCQCYITLFIFQKIFIQNNEIDLARSNEKIGVILHVTQLLHIYPL